MFEMRFKVDDSPLRELLRLLKQGGDGGPVKDMLTQWGHRYLRFARRRYLRLARSRGGGEWPDFAASTRRKRGSMAKATLMIDTGTLVGALAVGGPGNLLDVMREGVRVGFSGSRRHPKGKASIADIAHFHPVGAGNLPKREILVEPDSLTTRGMHNDATRAVRKMMAQAEHRLGPAHE